jgi:DNA-binding protein H-NS
MNLDKLSLDDLKKLEKDVKAAISGYESRKRSEAIAAAEARAKEFGYSLKGLVGVAPKRKKALPAKYAHPENPSLTWSGQGRRPAWIKDRLERGKKLEAFLIRK